MPVYDFRCNNCGSHVTLTYRTVKDYDNASPVCSNCQSTDLTRQITSVAIRKGSGRDYTDMSSQEMLSVLESGDSRAVGDMMRQVGGSEPSLGASYHNAAEELSSGKSMQSVERDLRHGTLGSEDSD